MNFKQWLFNEVKQDWIDAVLKNTSRDKPFDDIFKGKDRIVVPYSPDEQEPVSILDKLKKENYIINYENGTIQKDKRIIRDSPRALFNIAQAL